MVDLSILIVNFNSWDVLADALDSIRAHPPADRNGVALDHEIVVVDNASPLRTETDVEAIHSRLRGDRDRLVLHDRNDGFSAGMNRALAHSRGRYLLVSNPDVHYLPGCLSRLVGFLETHRDVGAATPVTFVDPGLEIRLPTGVLPRLLERPWFVATAVSQAARNAYSRLLTRRYLPVFRPGGDLDLEMFAGWGFLIRRDVVDEIGFFDERYPLYYEDADLSCRVRRAGHRIVQVEAARMIHLYDRSARTTREQSLARHDISERRYFRRWSGLPAQWLVDGARGLLRTRTLQRLAAERRPPAGRSLEDLGGVPSIILDAPCADFLVEVAFDPYFLLCGGAFGSGAAWSPGPRLVEWMRERPVHFRVVDLTRRGMPELGRWHFDAQRGHTRQAR